MRAIHSTLLLSFLSTTVFAAPVQVPFTDSASAVFITTILATKETHTGWIKTLNAYQIVKPADVLEASCSGNVYRPASDEVVPESIASQNHFACRITRQDSSVVHVKLSLAGSPVKAWGNRLQTLPFSVGGEIGANLYKSLESLKTGSAKKDPNYSSLLLCDSGGNYCTESFMINQGPDELSADGEVNYLAKSSPMQMSCTRHTELSAETRDSLKKKSKAVNEAVIDYWDLRKGQLLNPIATEKVSQGQSALVEIEAKISLIKQKIEEHNKNNEGEKEIPEELAQEMDQLTNQKEATEQAMEKIRENARSPEQKKALDDALKNIETLQNDAIKFAGALLGEYETSEHMIADQIKRGIRSVYKTDCTIVGADE